MRSPRLAPRLAALSLVALVPLGLTTTPAGAAPADDAVAYDFDGSGAVVDLTNSGSAATVSQVVSAGGGSLAVAAGADGTDAVRFPAYDGSSTGADRAIIAVDNAGSTDALTPGAGAFSYGADVRLSATNHGSTYDDGNNLIQRGHDTTGASQFKLDLDNTRAKCHVQGEDGEVAVKVPVPTRAWYRLACVVTPTAGADTVTITATPIAADGSLGTPQSVSVTGPIGSLDFPVGEPISIGGKLTQDGAIMSSSDQLNGTLDNAFLQLG